MLFFFSILFTMKTSRILLLGLFSSLSVALEPFEQQSFSSGITIQNQVLQLTDDLVESQSILKSCSSCISLLQLVQKMSYFSESFLVNTLIKACKRTNKVDDDVVKLSITREKILISPDLYSVKVLSKSKRPFFVKFCL